MIQHQVNEMLLKKSHFNLVLIPYPTYSVLLFACIKVLDINFFQ